MKFIETDQEYQVITAKLSSLTCDSDMLDMEKDMLELKISLSKGKVYQQFCEKQIDLIIKRKSKLSQQINELQFMQDQYDVMTETIDVLKC